MISGSGTARCQRRSLRNRIDLVVTAPVGQQRALHDKVVHPRSPERMRQVVAAGGEVPVSREIVTHYMSQYRREG